MSLDKLFTNPNPPIPIRGMHLDLKGSPPTPQRLLSLLRLFAQLRINAVLIEFEDMFPWTVDPRFRCETAYAADTVRAFAAEAAALNIQVIPLVQCLGHCEVPLSGPGNESLREIPHRAQDLNPLAPGARDLIESMVEDVLALCPDIQYFHLGGDEAWHFGTHPDTKTFIEQNSPGALYLHHVQPILDKLNARGVTPILWHDMMRQWDDRALDQLAPNAHLMCWGYAHPDRLGDLITPDHMQRFTDHGIQLWGAGAYKGANHHTADRPALAAHVANALWWTRQAAQFNMHGVIATAWSRYATHRVQCETIEASLDSLVHVARILHDAAAWPDPEQSSRAALAALGQADHFQACADAAQRLADLRTSAWIEIQFVRELICTATIDARRRTSGTLIDVTRGLGAIVDEADAIARDFAAAHHNHIDSLWVRRYLAERIEPIREEHAALDARARQLNPVGYAANPG
ncbi:MAG: hypothetical protein CMJ49_13825 [Planctomycetaceae bacterium]|nr:hypothetical protein [Planctomycetaceae bacterium]